MQGHGSKARACTCLQVGTGPLLRYSVTNEVTFLSNNVTDRYFLFRVTDRVTEITFLVRYSVTFWSVTPLLRYSIHSSVLLLLIPIINNAVH